MNIFLRCSVLWVFVWCIVAQSDVNDVSNLQNVVSEILQRLNEKDAQIEKLQQRLGEQESLNAEQTKRLAIQDAAIENLHQRLRDLESDASFSTETKEPTSTSMSSNDSASRFKQAEHGIVRKS